MKNFYLLVLVMLAINFTGCKKDPDKQATNNIIGKWYLQSYNEKEYKNGKLIDEQSSSLPNQDMSIEFKSDGTAIDNYGNKVNYKISDSKLITREDGDAEDSIQDIKKLTSSELVLTGEDSWEEGTNKHKYTWENIYKKK